VSNPEGFEKAFAEAGRRRCDAVIVLPDAMYWAHRTEIVMVAAKTRLPTVYWAKDYVDVGGLMSYAASLNDLGHRAAYFIDNILNRNVPEAEPVPLRHVIGSLHIKRDSRHALQFRPIHQPPRRWENSA
jgi:putative tryptophan/tyrosine transport system substrate-binding protein